DVIRRVVADRAANRIPGQRPVADFDRAERDAGERRRAAHFVIENVAARLDHGFGSGAGIQPDANLVAPPALRGEKRGLFADDFGGAFLQSIDCRVFEVNVVADFGLGHGATHCWSWFCDRVTAKVYDVHMNSVWICRHRAPYLITQIEIVWEQDNA